MQGGWVTNQKTSARQLNKIKPFLNEVKNPNSSRILQSLSKIMNFYFGAPDGYGILYTFGRQFSNYQTLQWACQLQKLLQHIVPGSPMFTQLQRFENSKIIINNDYAPQYIQPSFYQNNRPINYRISSSGIEISPLDAYFMMLSYAIYNSQPIQAPTSQYQHLILDQFFSSLARNPLLILLRRNIQYFNRNKQRSNFNKKIVYIMKAFLTDELIMKLQQDYNRYSSNQDSMMRSFSHSLDSSATSSRHIQIKYRLKVHHLHALYLVMRFVPDQLFNNFAKYCQALVQYFSSIKADRYCLQAIIRLWIYGMTMKSPINIQQEVIQTLKRSNPNDGWYFLKRYSPKNIQKAPDGLTAFNLQTVLKILKLLQKDQNWIVTPSYLFSLACLLRFLDANHIYYQQLANIKRSSTGQLRQSNSIQKSFALIVRRMNESLVDTLSKIRKRNPKQYDQASDLIINYQQIIQQYFRQYFKARNVALSGYKNLQGRQFQLPSEFVFKRISQSDLKTEQSTKISSYDAIQKINFENKRKLIDFYRKQNRVCWQIPIQYNQSTILYYVLYLIAKILSFVIPGRKMINIRFLANPITFLGILVILGVLYLMFK